jgi:conjugal transfer pilus assembly protein TrbC
MFKINNLIIKLCIINISLLFSCSAAEQPKNSGVTQVDLEQLVRKRNAPSRQDSETAREVIEASRLQESNQMKKEAKQIVGQVGEGLKKEWAQLEKRTLSTNRGSNCTQCKNTLLPCSQSTPSKKENHSPQDLIIFVSSSMPPASLKALFWQAQRAGIPLVFRGLIDNSFEKTKSFFEEHQINGEIDPNLFSEYHVSEVPTFVIREGKTFDVLQGNISLEDALTLFKKKGELKDKATHLLTTMKASHS